MRQWIGKLAVHAGVRRHFSNMLWMFAEQGLRMVSGLLVGVWVARYLGPAQLGVFSYALAFAALFGGIAKLGLDRIVVRELVHDPDRAHLYLGTAFWLKLGGGLLSLLAVAAVLVGAPHDALTRLYIFIIASGVLFQAFEVIDFHFQARVQSRFVSLSRMTQLLLSSLLRIYLVLVDADLLYFVCVSLIDQITLALALYIAYRSQGLPAFYRCFDWKVGQRMLAWSWPMIFSSLAIMLYMRIDQIMIRHMLGERPLGIYTAAIRLSEVWYVLPVVVVNSVFPAIVSARQHDQGLYMQRLQKLYTLMVWLAVAIAVPMSLLADGLVTWLYGAAYAAAAPVLIIHVWSTLFVFLGVASGSWLSSENMQREALYRTLAGAGVNVMLNLLLIPYWGLAGAAVGTLAAQMSVAVLFDLCLAPMRPMFFMKMRALNPAHLFRGGW